MPRPLYLVWLVSMCGAELLLSSPAAAQSNPAATPGASVNANAPRGRSSTEALVAERQRLRAELTRAQGEIDQLKRAERGLRADYQLRARQADAESIARRLTDIDEQLRALAPPGAAPRSPARVGDEPVASPTDGPQELDAKADILTDQAHRVQAQAAALKVRIDQVRGRRELRRRAHQLEADPFAPLEGSKRRLLSSPAGARTEVPGAKTVVVTTDSAGPPPGNPVGGAAPVPGAGATNGTGLSVTQTPSTSQPVSGGDSTSSGKTTAAAPLLSHDQLDQSTLAATRKPGAGAGATASNDLDSMEKELAALNARAQHLDTQAQALRARARGR